VLAGNYRAEHLFALEQALALYDTYQQMASACDTRIEAVLKARETFSGSICAGAAIECQWVCQVDPAADVHFRGR
jgi:hypothetical protein